MKITVIGSGGWGLAMAKCMAEAGHSLSVWSHKPETTVMLREKRCNPKLLRGIAMPEDIEFTDDLACVQGCPIVVLAIPSFAVCETAQMLSPLLEDGQVLVLLSKGFDLQHDCCLLSDTLVREVGTRCPVVALTGPSHAEEVSRGIPTAVLAASPSREAAELVQKTLSTDYFRVYTSPDIVSAELGGAMKNIMAVAVGISDGYGYGDNTKAMLMTRGIAEMARLGQLLGGKADLFRSVGRWRPDRHLCIQSLQKPPVRPSGRRWYAGGTGTAGSGCRSRGLLCHSGRSSADRKAAAGYAHLQRHVCHSGGASAFGQRDPDPAAACQPGGA